MTVTLSRHIDRKPQCKMRSVATAIWTGGFTELAAGPVKDRNLFYGSYLQTYLQFDQILEKVAQKLRSR